jgi:amidophosphoribosyltransferase
MVEGLHDHVACITQEKILAGVDVKELSRLLRVRPRVEKIAIKDAKLRTFITQDQDRDDLVTHVYDITYGTVKRGVDNLVVIDDSIVRGTTLKKSIVSILDRLGPKRIVVVSSSPQIRYPDCYGIDMSMLGDFIAFKAAIELLNDRGLWEIVHQVYRKCKADQAKPKEEIVNHVKEIYAPFTFEEISGRIASMMHSDKINAEIRIIYQTVETSTSHAPMTWATGTSRAIIPPPAGTRSPTSRSSIITRGKTSGGTSPRASASAPASAPP